MDRYKIGAADPFVQFDIGAGPWNSLRPNVNQADHAEMFIRRVHVELLDSWLYQLFAPDAIANIEHFLDNTGTQVELSEKSFMNSTYCKSLYDNEIRYAKAFCEKLAPGGHYSIVSTSAWLGNPGDGHYRYNILRKLPGNLNIFYALGGFRYWARAEVDISPIGKDDILYNMDFTFILADRYNWNWDLSNNKTQGTGVGIIERTQWDDVDFALLNLFGVAQDFDIKGTYRHPVRWRKSGNISPDKRFHPIPLRDYL